MSSFTITTPEATVSLRPATVTRDQKGTATANYTVTNKTGSTKRTRLRIDAGSGAEAHWFAVRDGDEREIAPGATASFSVEISAPGGEGRASFNAVAINVDDPDNDYETGAAIAFDMPSIKPDEGGFALKWWMIAAPAALVLVVVGAVLAIVLWPDGEPDPGPALVTLPNFDGITLDAATAQLGELGIINVTEIQQSAIAPAIDRQQFYEKRVRDQKPGSDGTEQIEPSTPVELGWVWEPKTVTVPTNLVNMAFGSAVSAVEAVGLRYAGHTGPPGNPPSDRHYEAVASVTPNGGQQRNADTPVTFTVTWREAPNRIDALRFREALIESSDRFGIEIAVPVRQQIQQQQQRIQIPQ